MDKRSEYILKMYSEASRLMKKDAGWGGAALMAFLPTAPLGVLLLANDAIKAGWSKLVHGDTNLIKSLESILSLLDVGKNDSGGSNFMATLNSYVKQLKIELPKIRLNKVDIDATDEYKIKQNVSIIFTAKYSLENIKKILEKITSNEFRQLYTSEMQGFFTKLYSFFQLTDDDFGRAINFANTAKKQTEEFSNNLNSLLTTLKENVQQNVANVSQTESPKQDEINSYMAGLRQPTAQQTEMSEYMSGLKQPASATMPKAPVKPQV